MTTNDRPRIDSIKIRHEPDLDPGISDLGEYTDTPGPDDRTIDRGDHRGRGEYRYFVVAMSGDDTGNPDSVGQDYQRAEALNRGEWGFIGVYAAAVVSYSTGGGNRRLQQLDSGGLWGIESDREPEYIQEVERDELADLRSHLERFGVDTSNFEELAALVAR